MGLVLGASYLAGGAAGAAAAHARTARIAAAASNGFSEAALQAEAGAMDPGALAVARRHDPFTAAGAPERDLATAQLAARLERAETPSTHSLLLRVSLTNIPAARPFRMAGDNPLAGARELDCLSAAVYYEARGEGFQGQAAVAQVVLNRVRHPAFPKSVCAVVYQGAQSRTCQFSFACDGSMRRNKEPAAWRRAQDVAARALAGYVLAAVGGATHFHVASLGDVWGQGMQRVAQVGSHVFYRFSGRSGASSAFRAAPDLYVPPSELADRPVYAAQAAAGPSADGAGTNLILASAVTTQPLGQGGPVGTPPPPASAPAVSAAKPVTAPEKMEKTSAPVVVASAG